MEKKNTFTPALIVLVLANFIPVLGVLFRGWEVHQILVIYWLENIAVGIVNALKLLTNRHEGSPLPAKIFLTGFFCIHYGIFTSVHGAFVFSGLLADPSISIFGLNSVWDSISANSLLFLSFLGSHLFSFIQNYHIRGEAVTMPLGRVMSLPYPRIFVLHITIIFGGMAISALGSPIFLVVVLVIAKTIGDIFFHRKEREKGTRSATQPSQAPLPPNG